MLTRTMRHVTVRDQRKPGEHREPLRTLQELADEFGVHICVLKNATMRDAAHPQAKLRTGKRVYYEPSKFRTWWAVYGLQDHADVAAA